MSIYNILFNEIASFRLSGVEGEHSLEDRQFYVEQFMDRVGDRYVPKTDSKQIIRDWADERFQVGLDMATDVGKLMLEHLLSELPIPTLRAELQDCANDLLIDIDSSSRLSSGLSAVFS